MIGLLIVAMLLLVVTGCSPATETESESEGGEEVEETGGTDDDVFRVGLLVPSTITDEGWSQMAYEALQMMESELGAEISYVQAGDPASMIEAAEAYAEEGYTLIIGHGFQYSDPFMEVSPSYPDTIFLTTGGTHVTENQTVIEIRKEQTTYIAGAIAAKLTKTNKIGLIGGQEIPAVSKTFIGFEMGAKSVNPDIDIALTWVGSLDDVNAGYEAALSMIQNGRDVLYMNANVIAKGVIQAADEQGVWVFGDNADQSGLAPDHIVASVINDTKTALLKAAEQIQAGTFVRGNRTQVGMADGVTYLLWNDNLTFDQELYDMAEDLKEQIVNGDIYIPSETEI